jgi:hypothetical protein
MANNGAYFVEYTDTFGGVANYSWVRRAAIRPPANASRRAILRMAREAVGLAPGVKGDVVADYGDELHWKPRGCCTVLMARWSDAPHEVGEAAED